MVETTPTLGSIETTTQAKRAFAQQSLQFNLHNPIFCSLFPETACYIGDQLPSRTAANSENSGLDTCKLLSKKNSSDYEAEAGKEDDAEEANNNNVHRENADKAPASPPVGRARPAAADEPWALNGQVVNVCVFLGVAAFAFTVKCVLASTR